MRRIVDKNIDGAKLAESRLNDHATMFGRANIARKSHGLSTSLLDKPPRSSKRPSTPTLTNSPW